MIESLRSKLLLCRYKQNPEALKNMQNAEFFNSFKEIVLTAERSLLYALGFQLDIRHPYYWSTTILKRLGSLPGNGQPGDGPWWREYSQRTVSRSVLHPRDVYYRFLKLDSDFMTSDSAVTAPLLKPLSDAEVIVLNQGRQSPVSGIR